MLRNAVSRLLVVSRLERGIEGFEGNSQLTQLSFVAFEQSIECGVGVAAPISFSVPIHTAQQFTLGHTLRARHQRQHQTEDALLTGNRRASPRCTHEWLAGGNNVDDVHLRVAALWIEDDHPRTDGQTGQFLTQCEDAGLRLGAELDQT